MDELLSNILICYPLYSNPPNPNFRSKLYLLVTFNLGCDVR